MIVYSFGPTILHDGQYLFCKGIDLSPVASTTITTKIARLEGQKKTGSTVDVRSTQLPIGVLSPNGERDGLERLLDQLYAGLNAVNQQLVIHSDGRYFIGDCTQIATPITEKAHAVVTCTFTTFQPYALAANPSVFKLANQGLVSIGSSQYTLAATFPGGGTVFSRPKLVITNNGAPTITSLIIQNLTTGQQITPVGLTLATNDVVTIVGDPNDALGQGYFIYKNGSTLTLYDFTGSFPRLDYSADSWLITATASSTPTITAEWDWTARYLA